MNPPRAVDPLSILRRFAPGTPLRTAAELVVRQGTGALVLLASGKLVDAVSSGGFMLRDAKFTAQRLAELAKMDAGIVVSGNCQEILRANVHFIPDSSIQTSETGTRFRTAERLAKQTGFPVLAISEEGRRVAVVFTGDERFELRSPTVLHAEGNQSLSSLERLRRRLQYAEDRLTRLEVDDVATTRDVVHVLQRAELVLRLGQDLERTLVELGGDGHLIEVQATDLLDGVEELAELIFGDYTRRRKRTASVARLLAKIPTEELHDADGMAEALGLGDVDAGCRPRGIRALAAVPRLPDSVKDTLIGHFKSLPKLLMASTIDLGHVDGVGPARAQQLRNYLDRLQQYGTSFAMAD
jgi:diadenylate cyclase